MTQLFKDGFEDFDIVKVEGMDIEPSDKSVGIWDETFTIIMKDNEGRKLQLNLGTEQMLELIKEIKPFSYDIKFQEDMDKELAKENN